MLSVNIITITYNDCDNLLRTIQSVRSNKKYFHRFFIIDGNSIDGTSEVITQNNDIIDGYISEKDSGIYDAMNKVDRFDLRDNDFLIWINAGDELLNWDMNKFKDLNKFECAFFAVYSRLHVNDKYVLHSPTIMLPYNEKNFYPKSQYKHQGFLVRYDVFLRFKYDLNIGLQAENLLMSQCIINCNFFQSSYPISIYYLDGISNRRFKEVRRSYLKVAKHLGYSLFKVNFYNIPALLKYYLKIVSPMIAIDIYRKMKRSFS